jgi:hypothetical protein
MQSNLSKAGYKTHVHTLEEYYESYGLEAPSSEDSDGDGDEEEEGEDGEDGGEGSEGSVDESEDE